MPDKALWQKGSRIEVVEDESARFLDLAAFADGWLDPDEQERVAAQLAADPIAAADIAAARQLAAVEQIADAPSSVIARAGALVRPAAAAEVIPFRPRLRDALGLRDIAQWGSLAAAVAMAAWLGFALGMDTSATVALRGQAGDESLLQDLLDPPAGVLRELTEGSQT